MVDRRAGTGSSGRRGAILERLVGDLLEYSQRFLGRHGLRNVVISVHLHEGYVVKVAHRNSETFPLRGAKKRDWQKELARGGAHRAWNPRCLAPEEINRRLATRLNRLLQHFEVRFGVLQIKVGDEGAIKTFVPSPPLRPAEMRRLARLLGRIAR